MLALWPTIWLIALATATSPPRIIYADPPATRLTNATDLSEMDMLDAYKLAVPLAPHIQDHAEETSAMCHRYLFNSMKILADAPVDSHNKLMWSTQLVIAYDECAKLHYLCFHDLPRRHDNAHDKLTMINSQVARHAARREDDHICMLGRYNDALQVMERVISGLMVTTKSVSTIEKTVWRSLLQLKRDIRKHAHDGLGEKIEKVAAGHNITTQAFSINVHAMDELKHLTDSLDDMMSYLDKHLYYKYRDWKRRLTGSQRRLQHDIEFVRTAALQHNHHKRLFAILQHSQLFLGRAGPKLARFASWLKRLQH